MNNQITSLRKSIDEFLLKLNEEFGMINTMVEVSESNKKGLHFSDNASMGLKQSYAIAQKVRDFITTENEKNHYSENLEIRITLTKKATTPKNDMLQTPQKTVFEAEVPKYRLEDVILPEETRKTIDDAIATIKNFDTVYNQWNFKSKEPSAKTNICFWGAPGTGKTMCAHAIANFLGKNILIASYADIQSEFVGVGPKNLKEVFRQAEENNALLFFDEADSFLRKRTSDTNSSASMHYNSMTNEMMKHLEDFNGVVIFATNLTENTDEAFKTRISFSVEFKVPDENCRAQIIEGMIPAEVPLAQPFTKEDYCDMAKACDKFVGRDIRNAVKSILSVGAQNNSFPFKKEAFIEGFKTYQENKDSFNNGMSKKEGPNPLDIYTTYGCIHILLTYAAWLDGPETEKETEMLKHYSKLLSRNKLNISKLSDLPELEEILQEVKEESLKLKTLTYLAEFTANTNSDSNTSFIEQVASLLKIDEDNTAKVKDYYKAVLTSANIKEQIFNK